MSKPTTKREEILAYIKEFMIKNGYAPTVREIASAVGLNSPASAQSHINRLIEDGYLVKSPDCPRTLKLAPQVRIPKLERMSAVPVVGTVTAGLPILAEENIQDYMMLSRDMGGKHADFMLHVKGDSMVDAGIWDGDFVVVQKVPEAQNGDIVVALLEDEATIKTFYKENGHFRLQPENPAYDPIIVDSVKILGRVVGLYRAM